MMSELCVRLENGLKTLGIDPGEDARARLISYVNLLVRWNRVYNLTSVRDPLQMVSRHLLDALAVVPYLRERRVIDVGSGAGLPGIPLALALPGHRFTLLDANGKRCCFLLQACAELRLNNVDVIHERVEHFYPQQPYDAVITRAFAALPDILRSSRHLLVTGGVLLAMKGALATAEIAQVPDDFVLAETITLSVPTLEHEQRHLLRLGYRSARLDVQQEQK